MYEFHVDVHETFQSKFEDHEYGGNLSIHKDPESKMILRFRHDEAIFNIMAFSSRCWSGTHGEQPIIPKDNGKGIMYSCFQSCEFGFGCRKLSNDDIQRGNKESTIAIAEQTYSANISYLNGLSICGSGENCDFNSASAEQARSACFCSSQ